MKPETIYLDLDDTILDLLGPICDLVGVPVPENGSLETRDKFYEVNNLDYREVWLEIAKLGSKFWNRLNFKPGGYYLMQRCFELAPTIIVTALPKFQNPAYKYAALGKLEWLYSMNIPNFALCNNKQMLASPKKLLIDDHVARQFSAAGGQAVEVPAAWNDVAGDLYDVVKNVEFLCSDIPGVDCGR